MSLNNRKLLFPFAIMLVVTGLMLGVATTIPAAHAVPGDAGDPSCIASNGVNPCLSIVPSSTTLPAPGGTFSVKVNYTEFPTFSAWDLAIKTNINVLKPTSITLVETFSGTSATFSNCLNGSGAGCSSLDGAGIAHSAVSSLSGSDAGNGTLFIVNYQVVAGPSTTVTYASVPGVEDSSVSDPSGATVVDCNLTPGACLTGSVSVTDFSVTASPTSVSPGGPGSTGTSTITVSPLSGFTGTVNLAAGPNPANAAVTANLASPSVTITSGPMTDLLTLSSSASGTFTILVNGTSTGFPLRQASVTLTVTKDTSSTATSIVNEGATATTGTSLHDTATVTGVTGFTPTGSVTYKFFRNAACSGTPATSQTVSLSGGIAPDSASTGALGAGQYSFQASYSGDAVYNPSTSICETFTVGQASTTSSTTIVNTGTTTGASLVDTASVAGVSGFQPTGTLVYTLFMNGLCSGTGTSQTVTLSGGLVPNSASSGPLAAGSYSYMGAYSGDTNYAASSSSCEPFTVGQATPTVNTNVVAESGQSFHDTATVAGVGGFTPTGSFVYTFFSNNVCSGTGSSQAPVALSGGLVPNSASSGPLGIGSYSYTGAYSGDSNYLATASGCEPFSVGQATPTVNTVVVAEGGQSFHDTATVTGVSGLTPTGTFVYTLFSNNACSGTGSSQTVTLSGGLVPNSASTGALALGSYSYQGAYSGDGNYLAQSSGCEPFAATLMDFSVTASPSSVNQLPNGTLGSSTITVTALNGFQGTVTLAVSVSPVSGLGTTLATTSLTVNNTVTSQSTTLTLNATAIGNYVVTVTGSSTGFSDHSATVNVQVVDFTISASPNPFGPVAATATGTTLITITGLNGFTDTVNLAAIPFGPSASLTSTGPCSLSVSVTSCTATLSASADLAFTYEIDVSGTGAATGASHTLPVFFVVNDFSVSSAGDIGPLAPNTNGATTITVTALNGFTGIVTLTLTPSSGLTASLSQSTFDFSTGPASRTATLTVSFTSPATYSVDVSGASSGYPSHDVLVTVFPLATILNPVSKPVANPGQSLSYDIRVVGFPTFNGFDISIKTNQGILNPASVDLSQSMLPNALIVTECINNVGTNCVSGDDGPGVIHVAAVSLGGTASGDGLLFTVTYTAVQGDFSISVSPNPFGPVAAGATGSSTVTVTAIDATTPITVFNDTVTDPSGNSITHVTGSGSQAVHFVDTVGLAAVPFGPTASLSSTTPSPCALNSAGPNTSCTATLTASADLAFTYEIDVTGTGAVSAISHTFAANFIVNDFSVSSSGDVGPLPANTSGTTTITVSALNGFTGTVTLTLNPSSGLTASLSQYTFDFSSGPATKTAMLTVSFSVLGTYTVDVTGSTSGYPSHDVVVTVFPPATIFISPSSQPLAAPGASLTYDVRVVGFPTFNGFDVSVQTNPGILNLTSVDISGTMLPSSTVIVECVNGAGTGCTSSDGAGIAHVALVSLGSFAAGDGLLFTIHYKAVQGDFSVSASPNPFGPVATGVNGSTTVTVTAIDATTTITLLNDVVTDPSGNSIAHASDNGSQAVSFNGTVSLAAVPIGPNASLSSTTPSPCALTSHGAVTSCTATLSASSNLAFRYEIDVTGTDAVSSKSHTTAVFFIVNDFSVSSSGDIGPLAANTNGSTTITVTALNGFNGIVTLSLAPSSGLTASLSQSTFDFSTGPATRTATLTVSFSVAGTHTVDVTGSSSGYPTSAVTVTVFPPATIFINPSSQATASPGGTLTYAVRVVGFPTFNSFDISVQTDPTILLPSSVDLSSSMLPSPLVVIQCVNGSGTGCTASDGAGIVHVAAVSLGSFASGDGILFTITYTAVQGNFTVTGSPSTIGPLDVNATGTSTIIVTASDATTSITIFNDVVTDPSGNDIQHTTTNGSQTVSFNGTVTLSTTSSVATLSATSPNPCALTTGMSCMATLTASSSAGVFTITVTGMTGSITRSTVVTLKVQATSPPAGNSLFPPWFLNLWIYIVLAIAIIGLVFAIVYRKRHRKSTNKATT